MKLSAVPVALASLLSVFAVSIGLLATGGPGGIFAGDNREDSAGSSVTTISVECDADGTWQAYAAIEVEPLKSNGAVVVVVSEADTIAITDAVVDNGYVDGSPPKIAPGVADVLFKDGGAATNDHRLRGYGSAVSLRRRGASGPLRAHHDRPAPTRATSPAAAAALRL